MRESRIRVFVWRLCCFVSIVGPRGVSGLQAFDGRLACSFEDRPWLCGVPGKGSTPRTELLLLTLDASLCSDAREVGEYRLHVHRPFTDDPYVMEGKPFCGLLRRVGNDARGAPWLDFGGSGDVCPRLPFHPEGLPPIEEGKEGTLFVQARDSPFVRRTMWSAMRIASSMTWVANTTVLTPASRCTKREMSSSIFFRPKGSTPAVGSSRRSRSGEAARASAKERRR